LTESFASTATVNLPRLIQLSKIKTTPVENFFEGVEFKKMNP